MLKCTKKEAMAVKPCLFRFGRLHIDKSSFQHLKWYEYICFYGKRFQIKMQDKIALRISNIGRRIVPD